jgi:MoaA/NifB/PqqE/SkfB family radical SAM enzyme
MTTTLTPHSRRTSCHGIHQIRTLPILILFPHSRCNCRCLMCDIWKIRQVREITPQDLEPHLESLRALEVRWVVFSGGEPLMHSDLAALAQPLRAEGIRVTLLTAGLLLDRHARLVAECFDDVIVSLDGPPAIHDQIRGVPKAFERLARGVESLRQHRASLPIRARTTIQRANHLHLRHTVRAARNLGLNSVSFLAVDLTSESFNRPHGWPVERQGAVSLGEEDVDGLAKEIEALIEDHAVHLASGFIAESPEKLRGIVARFRAHLGQVEPTAPRCNAPWVSAVIEADGVVRPCFFHPAIGSTRDMPLREVLNSPAAMIFREELDIPNNPICQRCVCSLYLPMEAPGPAEHESPSAHAKYL